MAKRKQISLIYRYNDNWIGGTYYILNIIKSLKLLDDSLQPEISILYDPKSPLTEIQDIEYPYISYDQLDLNLGRVKKIINKFFYGLNGKTIFRFSLPKHISKNIYPLNTNIEDTNLINAYYWIPDFQEHYYPEFYSSYALRSRKSSQLYLVARKSNIVFSSENARIDFDKFFPGNQNNKKVLNFASFIKESYKDLSPAEVLSKFSITKPYFIVCNQFWKHKNHEVVLKALVHLKDQIGQFQVVFTGKEYDYRNPNYVTDLKAYIKANGLEELIKFLGFIDRDEQLVLMNESVAIIQPSLFEGWSTVVEDSKVLGKLILVSDIPLHREQINENCLFFDPGNPHQLAGLMRDFRNYEVTFKGQDYMHFQRKFANDFMGLFE